MPSIVLQVLEGPLQGRTFSLEAADIQLGRSGDSGIDLSAYQQVSRQHARIYDDGPIVLIQDLGSTNGVYLNGNRIAGPSRLTDGAILKIGDFVARIGLTANDDPGTSPSAPISATTVLQPQAYPASPVHPSTPAPAPAWTTPPASPPPFANDAAPLTHQASSRPTDLMPHQTYHPTSPTYPAPQYPTAPHPAPHQYPTPVYPQQQNMNQMTNVVVVNESGGFAYGTASLVLSILSLLFFCLACISLPLAVISVILGLIAIFSKHRDAGMGIAGVCVSGLMLLGYGIYMMFFMSALAGVGAAGTPGH
jgi:hypothetical protein